MKPLRRVRGEWRRREARPTDLLAAAEVEAQRRIERREEFLREFDRLRHEAGPPDRDAMAREMQAHHASIEAWRDYPDSHPDDLVVEYSDGHVELRNARLGCGLHNGALPHDRVQRCRELGKVRHEPRGFLERIKS